MSRTILVPHDGSSNAQAALKYALETVPDARIVLFHAIDPFEVRPEDEGDGLPPLTEAWYDDQRAAATDLLEKARDGVADRADDVTFELETAVGAPPQTIVAAVNDTDADQIVIGRCGRSGPEEIRMGSTAEHVVKRASVPVTVVQ
ncbi:universal stress protein [Halopiger xanaduensis]|uniref:UspA domain-containing protein n=1 Tax=Halopiger xanaduensis (strain DSM 18323 / JCM 14033 / SH-6) TaxID=797210 RepID=F8DE95_HALXS|nr:universal stress protein [Halopiger xanaduensis]AEH39377.1 UspA domain-containing protein [Halopiger xanaduensis SH-6]